MYDFAESFGYCTMLPEEKQTYFIYAKKAQIKTDASRGVIHFSIPSKFKLIMIDYENIRVPTGSILFVGTVPTGYILSLGTVHTGCILSVGTVPI